jgi:hypothetical protein
MISLLHPIIPMVVEISLRLNASPMPPVRTNRLTPGLRQDRLEDANNDNHEEIHTESIHE